LIERALAVLLGTQRVFLTLAMVACVLLAQGQLHVFVVLSTVAVLLSLFCDTCIIFYFVGTAVWIRDRAHEVLSRDRALAVRLDGLYKSANKLKAKTFPFATMGLAFALFAFILSGAYQVKALSGWILGSLALLWWLNTVVGYVFHKRAIAQNLAILDQCSELLNPGRDMKLTEAPN
jgi:hypothetical protein